jgi:hypothetical protein
MAKAIRIAVAGALSTVLPAVSAQSLINGEPLQYNHEYQCNGERIIVGHCRSDDDSSNCQVYYPDRPRHNGYMDQPVEARGSVVARLDSCAKSAGAQAQPDGEKERAPAPAAPGLGRASWQLLDFDDEEATFFTRSQLKRQGSAAEGWFTIVYAEPKDQPAAGISDIQFFQVRYSADCAKKTYALREGAYFDENGKLLKGAVIPTPTPQQASPRTVAEDQLNLLCGKRQPLADKRPLVGDGDALVLYYLERLRERTKP